MKGCVVKGCVCDEGGVVDTPLDPEQTHPPGPRSRHLPPPLVETATEADGTHPTGMYS